MQTKWTPIASRLAASALAAGSLVAANANAQTAELIGEPGRVVIPMNHESGHLQVEVMIADAGPFLFQLDTYASIDACVDDDFAQAMGFPKTGTTQNSDGVNVRTKDLVRIDALQLGDAYFGELKTLVDDYDWVAKDGRRIDGLLGFQLFRNLLLTIDYPNSQIVVERGKLGKGEPHCMPLLGRGAPDIHLELGGESVLFGIDTGMASALMMPLARAERLGLSDQLEPSGTGRTVYSSFDLFHAKLGLDLDLAGHSIVNPDAFFRDGDAKPLLGKGLLQPFALTFDQRSKRLRLLVPEKQKPKGVR